MVKYNPNHWFERIVAANCQDLDSFFARVRLLCIMSTLLNVPTAALLEGPAIRFFKRRFFVHHFRRAFGNRLRPEMEALGYDLVKKRSRVVGGVVLKWAALYRDTTLTRRLPA